MGSCFAEHIGDRLLQRKFSVQINPFGIVFNPASMAHQLRSLLQSDGYSPDLFERDGLWHSFDHHGRFSGPDRAVTDATIRSGHAASAQQLRKTNRLLLTLGTADVFVHRVTNSVVANCHKFPADTFTTRRLRVDEITADLVAVLKEFKQQATDLEVLITVSPVRHLRGGLVENQRSKATLVLACADICAELPFVQYFPAYELLLDDLRDYRFYAEDMVHPSTVAVDYIWKHFTASCFHPEAQTIMQAVERIVKAAQHRPFNPETPQHQAFVRQQAEEIDRLEKQYPFFEILNCNP